MDPEQQLVYDSLDILLKNKILKQELGSDEFYALTDQVEAMKVRYTAAKAIADSKDADAKQRELAKGLCASLAKGVPDMTKAAINAAAAFRKGDVITGSASVMDICAAVAPILGSLLIAGPMLGAAGGPVGMLAGALFSMVGQILMMFAPKGDSMLEQIEKLLDKLDQEAELLDIKTVQASITTYSSDVRRQSRALRDMLKRPIATHDDFLYFDREIVKMKSLLKADNPHNSVKIFTAWRVLEWLKLPEKQDMDRWPEVLGIFCKAYTDLVTSNLMISLVMTSDDMQKRMTEVSPAAAGPLTPKDKSDLENGLNHLRAYAEAHQDAYAACNRHVLQSLRQLEPVARNRGVFFVLNGGQVRAGTGKNAISRDKWSAELWNYCRRISITLAKEDKDPFNPPLYPRYHFWALENWHPYGTDAVWHGRFDSRKLADTSASRGTMVVVDEKLRGGAGDFSDIYALPAPKGEKGEYIYCSHGNWAQGGDLQLFKLDENNALTEISWRPQTKSQLMQLRLVTPFLTMEDDPDKDAMPPLLLEGSDHYNSIVYGALRDTAEIYVDRMNERCYVPSPAGSYSGIAVDSWFLWVFGPVGCQCASHASIMSYLGKKRAAPIWLSVPSLNQVLFDGDQYPGADKNFWTPTGTRPPFRGLIDFSSCEDRTLFVCADTRKVTKKQDLGAQRWEFTAHDTNALWTTSYSVDFKGKTIGTESWTKFTGAGGASQVQKLPIPCWNLLQSLRADLSTKVNAASA